MPTVSVSGPSIPDVRQAYPAFPAAAEKNHDRQPGVQHGHAGMRVRVCARICVHNHNTPT